MTDISAIIAVIFVVQLWFLTICCATDDEPQEPTADNNQADGAANEGRQIQPLLGPMPINQQGWHPQERKHRRRENIYWRVSAFVGFCGVIGAYLAAIGAWRAYLATEQQRVEMRVEKRPWLSAQLSKSGDLPAEGKPVPFHISIKNVGDLPGRDVSFISTEFTGIQFVKAAKTFCNGEPDSTNSDTFLFPNEKSEHDSASDGKMMAFQGSAIAARWLLVCVYYRSVGSPAYHHTALVYGIYPYGTTAAEAMSQPYPIPENGHWDFVSTASATVIYAD